MSNTEYEKDCNKCGRRILMKQAGGKWAAYELGGSSTHACGQNSKPASPPVKTLFTVEQETEIKRLAVQAVRAMMMESKN